MADRTNQRLGNYHIVRLIGRGGFAEVYLAEHIYLKTQVAIKLLQTRVSSEDDMKGFLQEAQTIARLIHPNIVRVTDFGVDGETPYLVMDYASNGTLRQRHPKGSVLPLPTIVTYVKQVAVALQYAHDEKLIHRDIKPENMLLGRKNEILLSDFGVALVAQSSRYQNTQDVVGTVAYMSPEQIQGKPRPASDQYSLGVVVYEWLSGDRPFHGSFTELCTQHMFAAPPPLREKVPAIHPLVEQVVSMALAKDYKQRFGSVQAFANALEQASKIEQSSETYVKAPTPPPPPKPVSSVPPTLAASPSASLQSSIPPQQSTPIPPPPPPVSGYSYPSYPSYSPQQYASYPQQDAQRPTRQSPAQKVKIWSIGLRQVIAMLIGTALFTVAGYAIDTLYVHTGSSSSSTLFNPIFPSLSGSFLGYLTLGGLLNGLIFVIPLFFAVEFGPWVGIIVAAGGSWLADTISTYRDYFGLQWYWYVAIAVLGFVAGLSLAITRGRYNKLSSFFIALFMSAVAIFLYFLIGIFGDSRIYSYLQSSFGPELVGLTLNTIVSLIPLLILLLIYNAVTGKMRQVAQKE
ncbi:MAG TPA: protein kinase [Ktedonobacteraceae bacterium]|nr:protein kinase [Ktedonobacteraceae bacterium]